MRIDKKVYTLNKCLLYTNIYTNMYCKFILHYCDMFRC